MQVRAKVAAETTIAEYKRLPQTHFNLRLGVYLVLLENEALLLFRLQIYTCCPVAMASRR